MIAIFGLEVGGFCLNLHCSPWLLLAGLGWFALVVLPRAARAWAVTFLELQVMVRPQAVSLDLPSAVLSVLSALAAGSAEVLQQQQKQRVPTHEGGLGPAAASAPVHGVGLELAGADGAIAVGSEEALQQQQRKQLVPTHDRGLVSVAAPAPPSVEGLELVDAVKACDRHMIPSLTLQSCGQSLEKAVSLNKLQGLQQPRSVEQEARAAGSAEALQLQQQQKQLLPTHDGGWFSVAISAPVPVEGLEFAGAVEVGDPLLALILQNCGQHLENAESLREHGPLQLGSCSSRASSFPSLAWASKQQQKARLVHLAGAADTAEGLREYLAESDAWEVRHAGVRAQRKARFAM